MADYKMKNWEKETGDTGSFTIKTIEGTGDRKQYWRIADSLVRNSNIYKRLSEKIYALSKLKGLNAYHFRRNKELYMSLKKDFREFEKDANRILKSQAKEIEKKNKQIEALTIANKKKWNQLLDYKQKLRVSGRKNAKLVKDNELVRRAELLFSKHIDIRNREGQGHAEFLIRGMLGFKKLEFRKEITMKEMMYLCVGMQMDAFGKEHVENRFGNEISSSFLKDIRNMVKKGYFSKIKNKSLYFITIEGKERFTKLSTTIFSTAGGNYWKEIFTKK